MKLGDRGLIEKWIVTAAIGFIIRQLEKFGAKTNWETVKKDLAVRAADLLPGTWLDAEAVELSNAIVDACARAFANGKTLEMILNLVADEKYAEAGIKLRDYLLKAWKPEGAVAAKAMSLVELHA